MGYSSTAEQRAVNSKVPGSNPGIPANNYIAYKFALGF